MEYLFEVNPSLKGRKLVIYGIGSREKHIFLALLQQNVKVYAFAVKPSQKIPFSKVFGKRVMDYRELEERADEVSVIVAGASAVSDAAELESIGIKNYVIDTVTDNINGVLIDC